MEPPCSRPFPPCRRRPAPWRVGAAPPATSRVRRRTSAQNVADGDTRIIRFLPWGDEEIGGRITGRQEVEETKPRRDEQEDRRARERSRGTAGFPSGSSGPARVRAVAGSPGSDPVVREKEKKRASRGEREARPPLPELERWNPLEPPLRVRVCGPDRPGWLVGQEVTRTFATVCLRSTTAFGQTTERTRNELGATRPPRRTTES